MRKHINAITVCVSMEHNLDVQKVINSHVDTIGSQCVYVDGDKVYIGFETELSVTEVAKIFSKHVYKTKIVGGTVFVVY